MKYLFVLLLLLPPVQKDDQLIVTSEILRCQGAASRLIQYECMSMMDELRSLHDPVVDEIVHKHAQRTAEMARQGLRCTEEKP